MDTDGHGSQEARRRGTAHRASGRLAAPARRSVRSSELRFGRPPRPVRSPLRRVIRFQQIEKIDTDRGKDGYRWMLHALICVNPCFLSVSIQNYRMGLHPGRRERGRKRTDGSPQALGRPGPVERRPRSGQAHPVVSERSESNQAPSRRPHNLLSVVIRVDLWFRQPRRFLGGPSAPRR